MQFNPKGDRSSGKNIVSRGRLRVEFRIMKPMVYRFRIEGCTLGTIPMARLAEYMETLAKMLGEPESVHFLALEEGSVVLKSQVDPQAAVRVQDRIMAVRRGVGPVEALKAAEKLNVLLEKDNTAGALLDESAEIIPFPGVHRPKPVTYSNIRQDGELDGWLARIGGTDKTPHATLKNGERSYSCDLKWDVARRMAKHLAGPTLRVYGTGNWSRTEAGLWELNTFTVREFEVLDSTPLPEVVEMLKAVPGNGWLELDDPQQALAEFREDGEAMH